MPHLWGSPLPPTPGAMLGVPGVAALPRPPALPAQAGGAQGHPAAAKPPPPVACLSFPFFWGGRTRCHCLPSALRPACPGTCPHGSQGPGSGAPPPSPPVGSGMSRIYVTPQTLFKDPTKRILFIYSCWCVWGLAPLAWFFVINISVRPALRPCLVGSARGWGGAHGVHSHQGPALRPGTTWFCSDSPCLSLG